MVLFSTVDCLTTGTLGFPRIGSRRELKFALEKYWTGKITIEELKKIAKDIEIEHWKIQQKYHIQRIGVGLFTLYDHVLDWTNRLGCIPTRFESSSPSSSTSTSTLAKDVSLRDEVYFAMARGKDNIPALEMKKWFDTNYHYLVPELSNEIQPKGIFSDYLEQLSDASALLGKKNTIPIVLGPLTFLTLSRFEGISFAEMLDRLMPVYRRLFEEIKSLDFHDIQIHEPSLVTSKAEMIHSFLEKTYGDQSGCLRGSGLNVDLVTYFEEIDERVYQWFLQSSLHGISLDFTQGNNLRLLEKYGFANNKHLGVGIINGRSVWKQNSLKSKNILERINSVIKSYSGVSICIQPSCSLQHLPYSLSPERKIQETKGVTGLYDVLAFAFEKLEEVEILCNSIVETQKNNSIALEKYWNDNDKFWNEYKELNPNNQAIQEKLDHLTSQDFSRSLSFEDRSKKQVIHQHLPLLPTSTIGSFPQTKDLRTLHLKYRKGLISKEEHDSEIRKSIKEVIDVQDQIGLDVLVHGEPERSDMVEYFAEKIKGFMFTEAGWVQSYGSRCTRPPIIYSDLERLNAMTTVEYTVAQSYSSKPVKGMLTGPGTLLKWSFPREDIPLYAQAYQLSLCIRNEIADLENAECQIIQVDEPGFREGMPLKDSKKSEYLNWAVKAFQLATAGARPETTIHTHMCYAEFHDCLESIDALDVDGILIENARNPLENLQQFKKLRCKIGVGMYDIHSPVVPSKEDLLHRLRSITKIFPLEKIMINPDCGLKTRQWEEVIPALKNMINATETLRQELQLQFQK